MNNGSEYSNIGQNNLDNESIKEQAAIVTSNNGRRRSVLERVKEFFREMKQACIDGWNQGHAICEERKKNEKLREDEHRMAGHDLIIISGPSGVGKDTIAQKLIETVDGASLAISCTTRCPRKKKDGAYEQHGVDYFFIEKDVFERKEREGDFLESAEVHGKLYGTPHEYIKLLRLNGKNPIILNIDPQGALEVQKHYPASTSIFILPPSADVLKQRLIERSSETDDQVQQRLSDAVEQVECAFDYDYVVRNDTVDQAVRQISEIIDAQQLRSDRQEEAIAKIVEGMKKASRG